MLTIETINIRQPINRSASETVIYNRTSERDAASVERGERAIEVMQQRSKLTRELELGTPERLDNVGLVLVLAAHAHHGLTDVHASNQALGLA